MRLNVFLLHAGGYRETSSNGLNFTPSYILSILFHQKSQFLLLAPPPLILKSLTNDIERPSNEPYTNPVLCGFAVPCLISELMSEDPPWGPPCTVYIALVSRSHMRVSPLSQHPEASSTSPLISGRHQAQSHYSEHTHNGLTINTSFARHCLGFRKSRSHMVARTKLLISWISFKNLSLHILSATLQLIMQAQTIPCSKR